MIISASKRTDIPAFYSDWFFNRLQAGYVLIQNPRNPHMFSRVRLNPDVVDCIVFWTKNPYPMLAKLDKLQPYDYYFQFTLTPYDQQVEAKLPSVKQRITIFKQLSEKIGKERVIWRYDPIFISPEHSIEYHKQQFSYLLAELKDYTQKCVISFIDHYKHLHQTFNARAIKPMTNEQINELAEYFAKQARQAGIVLETCAEEVDLEQYGIAHGACINLQQIEQIIQSPINAKIDKNQREACGCIESIDIGTYNTCLHECIYCYAITRQNQVIINRRQHDKLSPKLIGQIEPTDIIIDKMVSSVKTKQDSLF
ncbi:DUF1848 domain-containing protein [Zophobihabitans entericus]|uniref:DUF1848 domain-containing protein n=1 Tax=Zophobihabitans entericus TaxID=1635327 RepID=A0A6G9IDZ1_9GAMM|nr:DUF1848 domain-containing protein [Zophobihabitans entericus]QIQ22047.1 DUF1848 domain-containing protein [Zophobihabitans entericus]